MADEQSPTNLPETFYRTYDQETRDYWDERLEHNALRQNPKTGWGAERSYMLEAAGDVLRELTGSTGFTREGQEKRYLNEKLNRLKREAHTVGADYMATRPDFGPAEGQEAQLEKIRADIAQIKPKSEEANLAKMILDNIASGDPYGLLSMRIDQLRKKLDLLSEEEKELDRLINEPRSTDLVPLAVPPEEDPSQKKPKQTGKMRRGIGSLMRKRLFPIVQAAQLGWGALSDEQKGQITEFLNTPMHELVGMEKSGIDYFRQMLGMGPEEGVTALPSPASQEEGIASLEQSREARKAYDALMGITQNFKPTFEQLPGEWFLVEGQAEYADNQTGDYGHEEIVRRNVLYKLADAANDFLDAGINLDDEYIDETTLEYIMAEQVEGASDPQAVMNKMGITQKEVDVALGRSNATEYGIEELGYVRVAGNNLQLSGLTGRKMREVADGLYDAGGEAIEGMTFNVEDSGPDRPNKYYKDVPFPVLSSGSMKAMRDYDTALVGMEEGGLVETSELVPESVAFSLAHGGFVDKPFYNRAV